MRAWIAIVGVALALGTGLAACKGSDDEPEVVDDDQDGSPADEDCDDHDANIFPGNTEVCDGWDNDCDGDVDEDAGTVFYTDADDDGHGAIGAEVTACQLEDGLAEVGDDCDDAHDDSYPGAPEVCDGRDNDCDTQIDEDITSTWFADVDGDGYGDASVSQEGCELGTGWVLDDTDCDDAVASTHPDADETCNGVDDDCDIDIDEDPVDGDAFFRDADEDGFGDLTTSVNACAAPTGFVSDDTDCDDAEPAANPAEAEYCDGFDNNCDGVTDEIGSVDQQTWYADTDGDGYGDASTATDQCYTPGSSWGLVADDCDDTDAAVNPAESEHCATVGVDDDCDGSADEADADDTSTWYYDSDSDGYGGSVSSDACTAPSGYVADTGDCDDSDEDYHPGADEYCDSNDTDCDGDTDDPDSIDADTYWRDADGDSYGTSATSTTSCTSVTGYVLAPSSSSDEDCDDASSSVNPGEDEYCSTVGVDDDCDGTVDEADAVDVTTWYSDGDGDGYGTDSSATEACTAPSGYVDAGGDCDDTDTTLNPDTIWYRDYDADGYGDPSTYLTQCAEPSGYLQGENTDCNDYSDITYPGATEVCVNGCSAEGLDNDCDGTVDESCPEVHGTTISSSETWSASDDHLVVCDLYVYQYGSTGPTLTIDAGTTVEFQSGTGLYVGLYGTSYPGDLVVGGTSSNPVTFTSSATSPAAGDWDGVQIGGGASGTTSSVDWLTVEYGGAATAAMFVYDNDVPVTGLTVTDTSNSGLYLSNADGDVSDCWIDGADTNGMYLSSGTTSAIDSCVIDSSASYGIYLSSGNTPTITNTEITNNGSDGVYCSSDCLAAGNVFSGNTVTDNGGYPVNFSVASSLGGLASDSTYVTIDATTGAPTSSSLINVRSGGTVSSSATWEALDVPVELAGWVYVYDTSSGTTPVLTLQGGLEIGMTYAMYVGSSSTYPGEIVVDGTAANPVTMRAHSAASYWENLYLSDGTTGASSISGLVLQDAGGSSGTYALQANSSSGTVSITDVVIDGSSGISLSGAANYNLQDVTVDSGIYGIRTYASGDTTITDATLSNLTYYGVYASGTGGVTVDTCTVENVGYHGIHLYNSSMVASVLDSTVTNAGTSGTSQYDCTTGCYNSTYAGLYAYVSEVTLDGNTFDANYGDGVSIQGGDAYIDNNTISDTMTNTPATDPTTGAALTVDDYSDGDALFLGSTAVVQSLTSNALSASDRYPIAGQPTGLSGLGDFATNGNTRSSSGFDYVGVVGSTINTDVTWDDVGFPYRATYGLYVYDYSEVNEPVLTLDGADLEIDGYYLYVGQQYTDSGGTTHTLTGSLVGDNGCAISAYAGRTDPYYGIYLNTNTGIGTIDNCDIQGSTSGSAIQVSTGAELTLSNSTIGTCSQGLSVSGDAVVSGTTIDGCTSAAISVSSTSASLDISDSTLSNNPTGIWAYGPVTVYDLLIEDYTSYGIYVTSGGSISGSYLYIDNTPATGGYASSGYGLYQGTGTASLSSSSFKGNWYGARLTSGYTFSLASKSTSSVTGNYYGLYCSSGSSHTGHTLDLTFSGNGTNTNCP